MRFMAPLSRYTEVTLGESVRLVGTDVFDGDRSTALQAIRDRINSGIGGYVCFVNVHVLTESTANEQLRVALRQAAICFPDGMPLVWLSRMKGYPAIERVCGPDLTKTIASAEKARHFGIIGGVPGRAESLAAALGITATSYSPPVREFSVENALEDWRLFLSRCPGGIAPTIVLVGLGAPKQELWMHTVSSVAPNTLFLGIGAAFDFLSGHVQRAPLWMRNAGLEWAHRLAQDPRRLWKRYVKTNSKFLILALRDLVSR